LISDLADNIKAKPNNSIFVLEIEVYFCKEIDTEDYYVRNK